MANAVTSRRDGDDFQARMFWMHAVKLLDGDSPVLSVGFEVGPSGFDDIWVEYSPGRGPQDVSGRPLVREHIQCKWHVSPNSFGYQQIIDPEFIGGTSRSFLQRARSAQSQYAPDGTGLRFHLLTNWRIDRKDPLREIVSSKSAALRMDRLFDDTTDISARGKIRKAWREHLDVDEDALRRLTSPRRLWWSPTSRFIQSVCVASGL